MILYRGGIIQLHEGSTVNLADASSELDAPNVVLAGDYIDPKEGRTPQYATLGIVDGQVCKDYNIICIIICIIALALK